MVQEWTAAPHLRRKHVSGMAGPEHTLHLHTQARGTNGAKKLFTPLSKRLLISTLGMWAELGMTTPPWRDPIGCLSLAGASLVVCDATARPELHPQFPVPRRRVLRRARPLHPSHPSRCGVAARAGRPAAGCECAGSCMGLSLGVGGPRGCGGTGGAEWETGRANGGSHLPRAPRWAAGLRRGHSLLQSQSTPLSPAAHFVPSFADA